MVFKNSYIRTCKRFKLIDCYIWIIRFSAIRNHSQSHNTHTIIHDQFTIIATVNSDSEWIIKESILIKQLQPNTTEYFINLLILNVLEF